MGKTYLLFDSGGSYSVSCDLYSTPKGHSKRDDAYIVSCDNDDFQVAAKKATYNVHKEAEKRGVIYKPVSVGFELLEQVNAQRNIAGESCGLAFIVALSQKIMGVDIGNIAATGVIEENGKIGPVKGIQAKLEAAANLLLNGDTILYPKENKKDIPESLKQSIREKEIHLLGVSSISNLFDVLFQPTSSSDNSKSYFKFFIGAVIVLLIAAGIYYYNLDNIDSENVDNDPQKVERPVIEKKSDPIKIEPIKAKPVKPKPKDDKGFL